MKYRVLFILITICVSVLYLVLGASDESVDNINLSPEKRLKVLTYNVGVFSKYSQDSTPDVARLITELGVDVVSLNELDSCNRRNNTYQLKSLASELGGWNYSFASAFPFAGGAYGNGIVSKDDITSAYAVQLPVCDGAEPRCMAVVETLDYVIAATHLDHKSSVARFQQAEYISKWFAQRYSDTTKPVFLCGDMNDFPESDTIRRLLEDWTIVSAIEPTYPSTNPKKCIDYIFCLRNSADVETVSSNVVSACTDFRMDLLSDHLPVVVEVLCK